MHPDKRVMALIIVVAGAAVIGSYIYGVATFPTRASELWGEVPESIRPPYTGWMFVAATGFFLFSYFLLFQVQPDEVRLSGAWGFRLFHLLYVFILVPSALWMPLTLAMIANPGPGLWLAVRLTLWIVAIASVGLVVALLSLRPRHPRVSYWLAVAGSIAFTVQTGVIDAIVWVHYFPA